MDTQLSLKDWIAQQPLPEEIKFNEDGSVYIPVEFIKPKLSYLSPTWGTTNFIHSPFEIDAFDKAGNKIGRELWFTGSAELNIEYEEFISLRTTDKITKRTLTGSATFNTQKYYPNTNWAAICLSLCIVAAAKELGDFFGKSLNKERLTVPTEIRTTTKKESRIINTVNDALKSIKK